MHKHTVLLLCSWDNKNNNNEHNQQQMYIKRRLTISWSFFCDVVIVECIEIVDVVLVVSFDDALLLVVDMFAPPFF